MTGFGPLVSGVWLVEHLDDPDLVVVDTRWSVADGPGRGAYEAGHIPGAVFADLDTDLSAPASPAAGRHPLPEPSAFAAAMSALGIGDATRVVVYDDAGGIIAARLWWMLDVLGSAVAVLDGGIVAWPGALSTVAPVVEPVSFTVAPWPIERMVTADELMALLGTTTIIDARSAERYAAGSEIDPRPGHVPGARSAPATANLANGRWRDPAALAAHYVEVGADGPDVVAYCGSGVTACADLLGRRIAGLPDGRLYVGSWSQWGADASRPAEV
ncbi:MAG: sulfurtransferase [Acidimicrobiales bacterium]